MHVRWGCTPSSMVEKKSSTFVDLEHPDARPERPKEREGVTLFLERPYISGVGPEVARRVLRMYLGEKSHSFCLLSI